MFKISTLFLKRSRRAIAPINALLLASAILTLSDQPPALSQSTAGEDLICYFQTQNGQVLNLSKLCGHSKQKPVVATPAPMSALSTTDQQFLETYQGFLSKRAKSSPAAVVALAQSQQSPQAIVERAMKICTAVKTGTLSQGQLPQGSVDSDLINTMAFEYYCPELDD